MPAEREDNNLDEILSALRHESVEIREQAIKRLQIYVNQATSEETKDTLTKWQAIVAWADARTKLLQDSRIVETLLLTIEDSSPHVRTWTALLLGKSTRVEAQEALIRHLHNDPVEKVRITCSMGLGYRPHSALKVQGHISVLQDRLHQIVSMACISLGQMGDPQAIEPLRSVLDHPVWNVRFEAAHALVRLKAVDVRVVQLLKELDRAPEAEEHNEMMMKADALDAQIDPEQTEKDGQQQTTQAVLKEARRLLSRTSETEDPGEE